MVSSGVKLVTLEDYTNQMYTEAQIALQEQGLNVEVALQASDSITKNYIVFLVLQVLSTWGENFILARKADRLYLQAQAISFVHPTTGKRMHFELPNILSYG